ncbi:MAG: peptidoglycan glycosyltransferase [Myxococcota bacterium]
MDIQRLRRRLRVAAIAGLTLGLLFVAVQPGGANKRAVPNGDTIVAPLALRSVSATTTAEAGVSTRPPAPATTPVWRIPAAQIDPAHAVVEGDQLVQHLDDGTRVELTLDPMLQRAALRSLKKYEVGYGVVVAMRPKTGEILAMAEYASGRPDLRRLALQAEGPAASIFKIVSSAALVELAGLQPDDRICTHGGRKGLSLYNLRPDAKRDQKCQSLGEALGSSNNVAFARWADKLLRPTQLQAMSERFLFNRRIPFVWGTAVSRVRIPSSSRLGFARSAAGFEGSHLSPLHAAMVMGSVANGGAMMAPRLVRGATLDGVERYRFKPAVVSQTVKPDTARKVLEMMVHTTTTGTGRKFFEKNRKRRLPGIDVAGKTGSLTARDTGVTRHYSWFVGAAPADDPEIVIASLVVNGAEWTVKGIVPARELLSTYFTRKQQGSNH